MQTGRSISFFSAAARLPTFLSVTSRPRSSCGLSSKNTLFICPECFRKGGDNEILATWGDGHGPNASVFGALDPADQALREELSAYPVSRFPPIHPFLDWRKTTAIAVCRSSHARHSNAESADCARRWRPRWCLSLLEMKWFPNAIKCRSLLGDGSRIFLISKETRTWQRKATVPLYSCATP